MGMKNVLLTVKHNVVVEQGNSSQFFSQIDKYNSQEKKIIFKIFWS